MARNSLNLRFCIVEDSSRCQQSRSLRVLRANDDQMIRLAHLKHDMRGVGGPAIQPNLKSWIGRKSLHVQPSGTSESQQAVLRCGWSERFAEGKAC